MQRIRQAHAGRESDCSGRADVPAYRDAPPDALAIPKTYDWDGDGVPDRDDTLPTVAGHCSSAHVRGDVFQKRMDSGQWALANPIDARAAKFANAAISGVDAAQKLTQRMFHDLGPGSKDMRIEDAFRQWSAKYTASS